MRSMTGFGLAKGAIKGAQVEVSLRSVNGRFLELRFHLPKEYLVFESELKKIAEKHLDRGTVDIFISRHLNVADGSAVKVKVNRGLLKEYSKAFHELARELKSKSQIPIETIARLPEILKVEDKREVNEPERKMLIKAFTQACAICDSEREREGKSLKKNMHSILDDLERYVQEMNNVREEANKLLADRYEQKIQNRMQTMDVDKSRMAQEIAILIEKSDINEELSRLSEHIQSYRRVLDTSEAKGKKLEFYTQELLREVNTIGSKSSVFKLTQIVVEAKTVIERLREQVQNVE